jgi:hypothetical protein
MQDNTDKSEQNELLNKVASQLPERKLDPNDMTDINNARRIAGQMKEGATGQNTPETPAPEPDDDDEREKVFVNKVFAYAHLPEKLRVVSEPFGILAKQIVDTLPANKERTKALDNLLAAKDAAVRSLVL